MGGIDNLTITGWTAVSSEALEDIRRGDIGKITNRVVDGHTLTVTTTKGTFVLSAPDLDDPNVVTASDISNAMARLGVLQSGDVLFDIYMVMQLAFQVAKQERTTAREMRNLERDLQLSEIGKQVDSLRSAAAVSMVMGFATAGITLGMAGLSAYKLGTSMKQQISMDRVSEFRMARTQLTSAESRVTTLGAELEKAKKQIPVGDPTKSPLVTEESARAEVADTLSKKLDAAKESLTKAQKNFDAIERRMTAHDHALCDEVEKSGKEGTIREKLAQAQKESQQVGVLNQATMGITQAMQGLGSGLSGVDQAYAERHRGEAAKAESMAQEQAQWMQEMRDLVKDVQEKLQGILQSQSDTMKTILRV
jgi:hypothetical protein